MGTTTPPAIHVPSKLTTKSVDGGHRTETRLPCRSSPPFHWRSRSAVAEASRRSWSYLERRGQGREWTKVVEQGEERVAASGQVQCRIVANANRVTGTGVKEKWQKMVSTGGCGAGRVAWVLMRCDTYCMTEPPATTAVLGAIFNISEAHPNEAGLECSRAAEAMPRQESARNAMVSRWDPCEQSKFCGCFAGIELRTIPMF